LPAGARCVSVDGDSDRLVYFTKKTNDTNDNAVVLFDGDKIAALIATHVADLLARCVTEQKSSIFSPPLRVGVVQTAYANGASTAYVVGPLHSC
jgi:phosphoacetylglucosamine mutase